MSGLGRIPPPARLHSERIDAVSKRAFCFSAPTQVCVPVINSSTRSLRASRNAIFGMMNSCGLLSALTSSLTSSTRTSDSKLNGSPQERTHVPSPICSVVHQQYTAGRNLILPLNIEQAESSGIYVDSSTGDHSVMRSSPPAGHCFRRAWHRVHTHMTSKFPIVHSLFGIDNKFRRICAQKSANRHRPSKGGPTS